MKTVDSSENHVSALGTTSVQSGDVGNHGEHRTDNKKPCKGSEQLQGVGLVGNGFAALITGQRSVFVFRGGPSVSLTTQRPQIPLMVSHLPNYE